MALLDLAQLIEALQFGKLKTRNDAINTLSEYSIDNLKLSPKQTTALLKGLGRSLQEERDASNANSAATKRITNTLTLIHELVDSALINTSICPRYKTICDFGITLIEYYRSMHVLTNLEMDELLLLVLSFKGQIAKILSSMLSNWPVFTHLLQDMWYQYYKFCIDAIKEEVFALKQTVQIKFYNIKNELLLVELFSVLQCLIGVDTSYSIVTLVMKNSYHGLHELAEDSFNCFKQKETPLHITILKIINKLLQVIASEDIWFTHCIANLGVKIILQFVSTRTESLATQICILLNNDLFHRYLNLNLAAETLKKSQDASSLEADIDPQVQLYNIEKILDTQIGLAQSLKSRLADSDIELVCSYATDNALPLTFYLLNVKLTSDSTLGWLLLNGISKTLISYYRLRRSNPNLRTEHYTPREVSFSTDEPQRKRRRTLDCRSGVIYSQDVFEFIYKMLNSTELSEQTCALQILIFILGNENSKAGLNIKKGLDEFDVDVDEILRIAIALTSKLPFWALLGCRSLLEGSVLLGLPKFDCDNQLLLALLKCATSSIGDEMLYRVAAEILYFLTLNYGTLIMKGGLPSCLDELISSPVLTGPPCVDFHACLVWVSLSNVYLNLNMNYRKSFYKSLMIWILDHFSRNHIDDKKTGRHSWNLSVLVGWFAGAHRSLIEKSGSDEMISNETLNERLLLSELTSFICCELSSLDVKKISPSLRYSTLSIPPELVKSLLIKICKIYSSHQFLCQSADMMVYSALILDRISSLCEERFTSESAQLSSVAIDLMLTLARKIGNKETAICVISTLLSLHPSKETLSKLNFPFEIIDYRFNSLPISHSLSPEDASHSFLEEEFSQSDTKQTSSRTKTPELNVYEYFDVYINFILCFQNRPMEKALTILQNLPPKEISHCLIQCLDFLDRNTSSVTEAECLKFVRLIGEKCLSSAELERDFNLLIFCCKIMKFICLNWHEKQIIKKDYNDLFNYIQNLAYKRIILSGEFYCHFAALSYVTDQASPESSFVSSMTHAKNLNSITVSLIDEIGTLGLEEKALAIRFETIYSLVSLKFGLNSVEHDAVGCFFILNYIKKFPSLISSAVKCLTLLSIVSHMVPYIKNCISLVAKELGETHTSALLQSNSVSVLKTWFIKNGSFATFPYQIFGYNDLQDFQRNNYRSMMCVINAIDVEKVNSSSEIEELNTPAEIGKLGIWKTCIPKMIPLAYTSNGYRNNIFNIVGQNVKESYKTIMEQVLNLTILETILMTDYSNEESLLKAVSFSPNDFLFSAKSEVTDKPETSISPNSSKDLIFALIEHYERQPPSKYWKAPTIHFFLRRLSISNFQNSIEKVRAIKFFLCISKFDFQNSNIIRTLLDLSSSYVSMEYSSVVASLHEKLSSDCFNQLLKDNSQNVNCCIIKILSDYISQTTCGKCSMTILDGLEFMITKEDGVQGLSETAKEFYLNVMKFIKDSSQKINLSCIEKYFEDPAVSLCIKMNKTRIDAILIRVFPSTSSAYPSIASKSLIPVLLDQSISACSKIYGAKVADYLGNLYLKGIPQEKIDQIASRNEYEEDTASSLDNNLSCVLKFMSGQLLSENKQTVAFIECVIGVLNHYWPIEESDVQEYFDLTTSEELLYIANSVNFEEFASLYPLHESPESTSKSETMENPVITSGYSQWIKSMFSCIFESWNSKSKILKALRHLICNLPEAHSLIPRLWCFHVKIAGKRGMDSLLQCLQGFYEDLLLNNCSQCINLVKDLVLTVRIYAIAGQKLFKKLYESFDLRKLFFIFKDSMFSKTSLLLFDDLMHATTASECLSSYEDSLTDLYIALDEVDLLAGLPEKTSLKSSFELLKASAPSHEILKYDCASFDSLSALNQVTNVNKLSQSFFRDGQIGIPMLFNESLLQGTSYQWAWKLNKWELPYKEENMNKDEALYNYLYYNQNAANQSDSHYVDIMSDLMRNRHSSETQSYKNRLNLLNEFFETLGSMVSVHKIMEMKPNEFEKLEEDFKESGEWCQQISNSGLEILQARAIALRNHSVFKSDDEEGKVLATLAQVLEMVKYNDLARHRDLDQKVLNSTILLDEFVSKCDLLNSSLRKDLSRRSTFQAARALWADGKSDIAIAMCESLTKAGSIEIPYGGLSIHQMLIDSYKVKWISKAHLDSGLNLLERHVEPITLAASKIEQVEQRDKVYRLLADFCNEQFNSKQLSQKIRELRERINSRKQEVEDIKIHYSKTSVTSAEKKRVQKYYSRLKLQISSQSSELDNLIELKRKFQRYSVKLYLKSILLHHNEGIADKLFSLMMEQASDVELQKSIESDLSYIPASTCVNWVTQLLSRVSTEACVFQTSIKELIFKVCLKHPYHSLYYLISLEYHEDLADENENLAMFMRVKAAKEISSKLNLQIADYVDSYLRPIRRFCQESVQLSQYKISKGRYLLLDKLKLGYFWLNELPRIPPPTLELPISNSGYENVPKMLSIHSKVAIATSGLSLPKIATFVLSNGESHKMLLKHSSDDIRQDAIMEQVFDKVKNFMSQIPEARKRNLTIRTYRAVPLGPKAGVIEFVANTTALIEIIRPYHQKIDLMKIETARDMMKSVQNENIAKRVKVYQEITKEIRPVLRNYFIDNFRSPDSWYQSRLAYSRGIATTSIVGHVLGLGDRHCNNILIDGASGEPVHIDLGVAFDQGRRLPIPETVPFRLTRDIVDGFGITKTRGLFSKACEHTLQILRDNENRILSILDVLRWDPLYSWSISPIRMNKLQETGEGELNLRPQEDGSDATTAILAVSEKLNAGGLSVSAAVRDLIAEATDENNLAVIYCGWCPFY